MAKFPVSLTNTATDLSGTIMAGGSAQVLTSSVTTGFSIYNPDDSNDLWFSESTTAAPNAAGSICLKKGGGYYETPAGYAPAGAVSIYGAVTGQKFTAKKW